MRYNKYRNKLSSIIHRSRKMYYDNILQKSCSNLKKTWSIVNELIGKKKSRTLPTHITNNQDKICDNQNMAEAFNNFFANIGKNVNQKVGASKHDFRCFLSKDSPENSFYMHPTNDNEIKKIVGNLKCSFSAGVDGLSSSFLKQIIPHISIPFSHICNLSIVNGEFPTAMKISKVIPVHKSGDANTLNNYRPISLLPSLSKVLERIMYDRLYKYLSANNMIIPQQFGFRRNYSTELALLHATELICSFSENKKAALGIFIDLSKAFDCLNHNILLQKLSKYGIRGSALQWFASYLAGRRQYVHFKGSNSDTTLVTTGVPQGSILGPLLFLLYVNDLVNASDLFSYILYADDTTLFLSDDNLQSLFAKSNRELAKISNWFQANKLLMNTAKTKFMLFNTERMQQPVIDINLKINDETIPRVNSTNFLGLIIDHKLNWDQHINHVSKKVSMAIGILNKVKSFLPTRTLFMLYNTMILPHFNYCSLVWGRAAQCRLHKLIVLQKRAIRICSGAHFRAHCEPLFGTLGTSSTSQTGII